MNQRFKQSVADGKLMKVRLALSNELLLDPRGDTFKEMLEYALEHIPDLYEQDDAKFIFLSEKFWDEDYMSSLHISLNKNFSTTKLNHFQDVVKVVLKAKLCNLNKGQNSGDTSYNSAGSNGQSSSVFEGKDELLFMAGGAISAIVGLCVSSTVLKSTLIPLGVAGIAYGAFKYFKK